MYKALINWDYNGVNENGSLWLNMGFEIDLFSDMSEVKGEIKFIQDEMTRKKVFLEQINLPQIRNSLKLDIYRKKRLKEFLIKTKQRADDIIEMIDEQLRK